MFYVQRALRYKEHPAKTRALIPSRNGSREREDNQQSYWGNAYCSYANYNQYRCIQSSLYQHIQEGDQQEILSCAVYQFSETLHQ